MRTVLLLLALALAAASCAGPAVVGADRPGPGVLTAASTRATSDAPASTGGASGPQSGSPSSAGLPPGHYRSTGVTGHTLVAGTGVDLRIGQGQITGQAGCNTLSGGFSMSGSRLRVGELAQTEMGCRVDLLDQDTWLGRWLDAGPAVRARGSGFVLDGGGVSMTFAPVVNAPLEGTTWRLTTIGTAGGAASPIPAGVHAAIRIEHGQAAMGSGCNPGGASVAARPSTLSFGAVSLSSMSCGVAAMMQMQETVRQFLAHAVIEYTIDGTTLTLTDRTGAMLIFDAGTGDPDLPPRTSVAPVTPTPPSPTR